MKIPNINNLNVEDLNEKDIAKLKAMVPPKDEEVEEILVTPLDTDPIKQSIAAALDDAKQELRTENLYPGGDPTKKLTVSTPTVSIYYIPTAKDIILQKIEELTNDDTLSSGQKVSILTEIKTVCEHILKERYEVQ